MIKLNRVGKCNIHDIIAYNLYMIILNVDVK